METVNTIILILGAGGLGAVISYSITWYKEYKEQNRQTAKDKAVNDLAANDQAVRVYKEILEGVKSDFDKLNNAYNILHSSYLDVKIELAKAQVILEQVKEHIKVENK